jgi:hypothetical protein
MEAILPEAKVIKNQFFPTLCKVNLYATAKVKKQARLNKNRMDLF